MAKIFFGWGGLRRIALAATLSGSLFAISDLIEYHIFLNTDFLNVANKFCSASSMVTKKAISFIEKHNKINTEIITLIDTCEVSNDELREMREDAEEDLHRKKDQLKAFAEYEQTVPVRFRKKALKVESLRRFNTAGIVLGFVIFLSIITFDIVYTLLLNCESIITVATFTVIIITYFVKEASKNKRQEELKCYTKIYNEYDNILDKALEDSTKLKTLEEAKELINSIKTKKDT